MWGNFFQIFFPPKLGSFFPEEINMEMEYSLLSIYFLFWRNFVSNTNDGVMYNLRFFFFFLAKFGNWLNFLFKLATNQCFFSGWFLIPKFKETPNLDVFFEGLNHQHFTSTSFQLVPKK